MASSNNAYSLQSFLGFVSNNFFLIILVLLFFAGGVVSGSLWKENKMLRGGSGTGGGAPLGTEVAQPPSDTGPTKEQLANMPAINSEDHIIGNPDARVVLVEYSDFECPYCQRFHPTMQAVVAKYGNDVAWVYRHFPLGFHPNAEPAAAASECVAKVGGNNAFWRFADEIFDQNAALGGSLNADAINAAITASGANASQVETCIASGEMTQKVTDHMQGGTSAGIQGTPGTIIVTQDGPQELIPGALPAESVYSLIDSYL